MPARSDSISSLRRDMFSYSKLRRSASSKASTRAFHCSCSASTSSSVSSLMISMASMAMSVFSCDSKETSDATQPRLANSP